MSVNKQLDEYIATCKWLEPEIVMVDTNASLTSIAVSMKRIADILEKIHKDITGPELSHMR